ncbi:hypothetical protein [Paludisphaera sp.]|uniref:hypothetical protein n=1 Tax=Paludisphaera sp. TaxID=2017432 RepID=UPI00301E12F2
MSILSKSLMTMGLAALMIAPASAQERRGPGGGMMGAGGSVSMLLSNRGVQDELKLDAPQKEKVDEAARKAREKFESARESAQNVEGQERFARMRELTREVDAETMKSLADVLKPEQVTRLHGIRYQTLGAAAFQDEHLAKALKLTDEQKSAVEQAIADSRDAMRDAPRDGDRQAAMERFREIREKAVAQVEAKLTDEQKAEYKKIIGAPFELRFEGRGPGGGRGPGR